MVNNGYTDLVRVVAALGAKLESFQGHWQVQDDRATAGREVLREKMEELGNDFQAVQYDVRDLNREVSAIKPVVAKLERIRVEAVGIARVGHIGWLVIGGIVATGAWLVDHWWLVDKVHSK
jgi:hypothetical protein